MSTATLTRVRLLRDYGPHKKGALLDIDGDVEDLITGDEPIARVYDEEIEKREEKIRKEKEKEEDERITRIIAKAVDKLVDNKNINRPLITVGKTGPERASETPGAWSCFGEHVQAVWKAGRQISPHIDERLLKVAGHMVESDDAQGGYLVPTEFLPTLLEKDHISSEVVARARPIPMQTNRIQIPAIAETSRVDGSRQGGLTAYWVHEAGGKTASKPTLRQITLQLNKLTGLVHVSDELLSDSPISVTALIERLFKKEMTFVLEQSFIDGTGVGQPLGVMNAGCLVTQAAEALQPAATIVFMNILRMWSRLWGPCRNNAIWLINQDAEPELLNLGLAVGTGGGPAYLPSGGLSVSPYTTLLGRPVIPCEHCQTLGTTGDLILADFGEYLYGRKSTGIEFATSIHYLFNYDEQSFRFVLRADGQPWWVSELTPKHGNNTMSPFVALATRP